jgi:hypothetical protein
MASTHLSLSPGEHSEFTVSGMSIGEILCLSGRARVVDPEMGIGWWMHAGDGCLLRRSTVYRITACAQSATKIRHR